jgi:hypothetical protein
MPPRKKLDPLPDPNEYVAKGARDTIVGQVVLPDGKPYPLSTMCVGDILRMATLAKSDKPDVDLLPYYVEIAQNVVIGAPEDLFEKLPAKDVVRICAMAQYGIHVVLAAEAAAA